MTIAYTQLPLLEAHALCKTFGPAGRERHALQSVTLSLRRGEFVAVLGPADCGKSTLLNVLGGLDRASAGNCFCDGVNVTTLDAAARARLRQQMIGFVFQGAPLLAHLSVLENVMLPLACRALSRPQQRERAQLALARIDIGDSAALYPAQLDAALRQRVALARAIVNAAPILLVDEPTAALDGIAAMQILGLLQGLRDSGHTILLTTDCADVAAHADRQYFMRDGRLYAPHAQEPPA